MLFRSNAPEPLRLRDDLVIEEITECLQARNESGLRLENLRVGFGGIILSPEDEKANLTDEDFPPMEERVAHYQAALGGLVDEVLFWELAWKEEWMDSKVRRCHASPLIRD